MQVSWVGAGAPAVDASLAGLRRMDLGRGAWIDRVPRWLHGHQEVFDALRRTTRWNAHQRQMYERIVDVPRLTASVPDDGPGHPILTEAGDALCRVYERPLVRVSLALYRDGADSVAWHGDRLGDAVFDAVVAIVSVGAPRRFLMRPKGGGRSIALTLGWGDLLVMGGTCQATWEHSVPKVPVADPRISVMFREARA